ncbi:hypothetical protein Tco_0496978 [Tanacetum coccineum]
MVQAHSMKVKFEWGDKQRCRSPVIERRSYCSDTQFWLLPEEVDSFYRYTATASIKGLGPILALALSLALIEHETIAAWLELISDLPIAIFVITQERQIVVADDCFEQTEARKPEKHQE